MRSQINIPHDMFDEILCRLAVKDVLRFRCLSKGCCDLIDSPDFVKLHLSHSLKTNSHRFLILDGHSKFKPCSLDLDSLENAQIKSKTILPNTDLPYNFQIIGSCNGLIALKNNPYSGDAIVICNPTTRKIWEVPKPALIGYFVYYGFGYDPVSDDYKLVALTQRYNKQNDVHDFSADQIYSFKSGNWRSSLNETLCFPNSLLSNGVKPTLVNNAWHWIIKHDSESKIIVAFDLTTEGYRHFPLPLLDRNISSDVELYYDMDLKELGGCLCMIGDRYDSYDIWVMKEYGLVESWTQLVSSESNIGTPVAYSKCGQKVLLCMLWITYEENGCWDFKLVRKLFWYNLKGEKIEVQVLLMVLVDGQFVTTAVSPLSEACGTGLESLPSPGFKVLIYRIEEFLSN